MNPGYRDLCCTEINLNSGEISVSREVRSLFVKSDLLEDGGIYFAPDASFLLYPKWDKRDDNDFLIRRRVHLVDTNTWSEEEILLDRKYSMVTGTTKTPWYEWKFNRDGKAAYILAKTYGGGKGFYFALFYSVLQIHEQ